VRSRQRCRRSFGVLATGTDASGATRTRSASVEWQWSRLVVQSVVLLSAVPITRSWKGTSTTRQWTRCKESRSRRSLAATK
jgi:hypothetical protein